MACRRLLFKENWHTDPIINYVKQRMQPKLILFVLENFLAILIEESKIQYKTKQYFH